MSWTEKDSRWQSNCKYQSVSVRRRFNSLQNRIPFSGLASSGEYLKIRRGSIRKVSGLMYRRTAVLSRNPESEARTKLPRCDYSQITASPQQRTSGQSYFGVVRAAHLQCFSGFVVFRLTTLITLLNRIRKPTTHRCSESKDRSFAGKSLRDF